MQTKRLKQTLVSEYLLLYLAIFAIFITIGVLGGQSLGNSLLLQANLAGSLQSTAPPEVATGQQNLLVIGVDQFNQAQPRLLSAWLLIYFPNKPILTLLPVYPDASGDQATNQQFESAFSLSLNREPGQRFLQTLRQRVWWSHYLVLDEAGFQTGLDALANGASTGETITQVNYLTDPQQNPQEALEAQVLLLSQACEQAGQSLPVLDYVGLLEQTSSHMKSNLNPGELEALWQSLADLGNGLSCEFPLNIDSNP
jgi:hypothetical protein